MLNTECIGSATNNLQNSTKTCLLGSRATSAKFFPTKTFTGFAFQSSGISSVFKWDCACMCVCVCACVCVCGVCVCVCVCVGGGGGGGLDRESGRLILTKTYTQSSWLP